MKFIIVLEIIIKAISVAFLFYINPQKAKNFGNLILYRGSSLLMTILMVILFVLLIGLSPLVFNLKATNLGNAYFAFGTFISLAIIALFFAYYYYKEFKNYTIS